MTKIAQIQKIVRESHELAEEIYQDLTESIQNYNIALEEFRTLQESLKLSTIDELRESLEGIENLPEEIYEPQIQEELDELTPLQEPKKFEIQEPKAGVLRAKFFGFFIFLLLLILLVGVAIFMRHIDPLLIVSSQWRESLENVFGFYSSLILGSADAGAAMGVILVLVISFGAGFLVYYLMLQSAAKKNLAAAKALFEDVKNWAQEQREQIEKIKKVCEFLEDAIFTIKGCRLFGDEYGARVKRERFFEGDDFVKMSDIGKSEIQSAQSLLAKLTQLASLRLYAKDFEIAQSTRSILQDARSFLNSLKAKIYG